MSIKRARRWIAYHAEDYTKEQRLVVYAPGDPVPPVRVWREFRGRFRFLVAQLWLAPMTQQRIEKGKP